MPPFFFPDDTACRERAADYGVHIISHVEPSEDTSGDMWGILPISNTELAIFIVDIAGHGHMATPYVPNIQAAFNQHLNLANDPAALLHAMNGTLHENLPTEQFATLFYGVLNTTTDTLTYATAATPGMVIVDTANQHMNVLDGSGFLLGAMSDAAYSNREARMAVGSTLLLYSDAIIESSNENREMWKEDGLFAFLETYSHSGKKGEELLHHLMEAYAPYRQPKQELRDDLTAVTITRK